MKTPTAKFHRHHTLLLFLLLIAAGKFRFYRFADAAQRKIHIPDELDDVVDDEEDDDWRDWGNAKKRPEFDLPPADFAGMGLPEDIMGPVFGFVKLRPGTRRTPEKVSEIATKWAKVARTGATEARFNGVDASTIMFTMPKGRNILELKEFLLSEPEAYEIKIGEQLFRRPGDPTFDEVFRKLQEEKTKTKHSDAKETHHEL